MTISLIRFCLSLLKRGVGGNVLDAGDSGTEDGATKDNAFLLYAPAKRGLFLSDFDKLKN